MGSWIRLSAGTALLVVIYFAIPVRADGSLGVQPEESALRELDLEDRTRAFQLRDRLLAAR